MKVLLLVLVMLLIPPERPKGEGIFIKREQIYIPMYDAYKMIERWPNYGGHRRK